MLQTYLLMVDTEEQKLKVEKIYTSYKSYMLFIANKYVKPDKAEDVVHDAMITIIRNIDNVDLSNDIKLRAFCGTVVKNKAKDYIKGERITVEIGKVEESDEDTEELVITREKYNKVIRVILELDDKYKDVCYLRFVNGMSEKDIGNLLDISQRTVNSRVKTGKQIIRRILKDE